MKCLRLIIALSLGLTMCGVWADDLPAAASAPSAQGGGWGSSSNATAAPSGSSSTTTPRTRKGSAESAQEAIGNTNSNTGGNTAANDPANPANPNAPAQNLLLQAMSLIGVKYKWGGKTPEQGLDCSGFVRYVFQNALNIALPHNALAMSQSGRDVDKTELKPGDLVFFNTLRRRFSHVGIYLGDNRFIHSPRTGRDIEVANMQQSYWTSRFDGARRIEGVAGDAPNLASLLTMAGTAREENRDQSSAAAGITTADAPSEASCRKITKGKGKHKRVVSVCSKPKTTSAKAATSTSKSGKKAAPVKKSSGKKKKR
ncbi:C40 family peptidase [Amantichitinum ursilacus]|uniref:Murein DD-endopeptidase MepH n=1 Tax=Amantichitinum ursilacus TaxID=857265 RepID=A0A0N0XKZ7_9NEIS|nr:C40 family peptidase [Amantichitinum ursilacus]KPC55116.1 Murein DD-endopeptidase MepH precursor [Amantichitinum ursilacus]